MYIEKHISNLKQYIKDDEIIEKDGSDFANFCKGHIDDIQAVLNELEKKDTVIDEMAKALKEYANLGFLIKCPAEYDGKYNYKYCKIDITKDRTRKTNRLCIDCIKEYFYKKAQK